MFNKLHLKFLLIVFFFCFFYSKAFAGYKHKVLVTDFIDPPKWNNHIGLGKILAIRLKNRLALEKQVYLLPDKSISSTKMSGSLKKNETNSKDFSASSYSLKNSNPIRFHPSKDSGFYDGVPDINDSVPSINYISDENYIKVIPIQDSMDNKIDKIPNQTPMKELDPVPWPVRLGKIIPKATLYEIKGQVVKFNPSVDLALNPTKGLLKKRNYENAELEVKIQLIQNKTGRVIKEKNFKSFSNAGLRPFSEHIDLHHDKWRKEEPSSMGLVFTQITRDIVSYVNSTLLNLPLEGDIISLKNKDVLINIGQKNGIEVGDKFRVFSLGLGLNDPLTESDLGDIYVKMGVIQVTDIMRGFSRALTIVGKDFMPGNVVRSVEMNN